MTLHDRFVAALVSRGYQRDLRARTGKYTVLRKQGKEQALFVGAAGGLRIGKSASASVPVNDSTKQTLLTEGLNQL